MTRRARGTAIIDFGKIEQNKAQEILVQQTHRSFDSIVGQVEKLQTRGQIAHGAHRLDPIAAQVEFDQLGRQTRQAFGYFRELIARQVQLDQFGLSILLLLLLLLQQQLIVAKTEWRCVVGSHHSTVVGRGRVEIVQVIEAPDAVCCAMQRPEVHFLHWF